MNPQITRMAFQLGMGITLLSFLFFAGGCKKDDAEETAGKSAEGVVATPKIDPYPVLDLGSEVLFYGGVKSFDALTKFGGELMKDMESMPAEAVAETLKQGIINDLGVSSIDWLNPGVPIRVIGFGTLVEIEPLTLWPVQDTVSFEATLPESKQADDGGNAWSWSSGSKKFYANFLDGHAAVSESATRFSSGKALLVELLKSFHPEQTLFVHLGVASLMTEIGSLLKGGEADNPGMSPQEKAQMEQLTTLLESVDHAVLTGTLNADNLIAAVEVQGKAVKPWTLLVGAVASGQPRLTGFAPESSYAVMGSSTDREAAAELNTLLNSSETLVAMLGFEGDEKKAFNAVLQRVESQQTGDQMFAMHSVGGFPFGMRWITEVKDGAQMHAAFEDLMGMMWKGGVSFAQEIAGNSIPPFVDLSSFSAALQSVGPLLAGFGVKLSHRTDAGGGGNVEVIEIGVDHARLEAMKVDPQAQQMAKSLLSKPIQIAVGSGKGVFAIQVGPDAVSTVRELVKGSAPAASHAGIRSMDAGAVPGASTRMWLSPLRAIAAFAVFDEVAPFSAALAGEPGDAGVGLSIGRVNDGTLRMHVDFPRAHTRRLVKGAKSVLNAP